MQRYMLERYVDAQADMRLCDVFCDNGETGTDFERPGFERLMEGIRSRRIDCVVVKDDCVIIELNAKSPIKCEFCAVSSIF